MTRAIWADSPKAPEVEVVGWVYEVGSVGGSEGGVMAICIVPESYGHKHFRAIYLRDLTPIPDEREKP